MPAGEIRARPANSLNRARRSGLPGRELVLGRRCFQFLWLKIHLVKQVRLGLIARSKKVALELLDRQRQMRDQASKLDSSGVPEPAVLLASSRCSVSASSGRKSFALIARHGTQDTRFMSLDHNDPR